MSKRDEVIDLRLNSALSRREIATQVGVSYQYVCQIYRAEGFPRENYGQGRGQVIFSFGPSDKQMLQEIADWEQDSKSAVLRRLILKRYKKGKGNGKQG